MLSMKIIFFIISAPSAAIYTHASGSPGYSLSDPPQFLTISGQHCAIKCQEVDYDFKIACQAIESELIDGVSNCNQESIVFK
jgi:hypothetical protein